MSFLVTALQQYGFSEKEAKVYLASLELGAAPGSTIARVAGEKRVTAYVILKEFIKQGICMEIVRNGVKYFSVVSPASLLKPLEEKYDKFKAIIPELLAVAEKLGNKPKIQFFEGLEGVKRLYEEQLTATGGVKAFYSDATMDPELYEYVYKKYIPERVKRKIKVQVILSDNANNRKYHNTPDSVLCKESRLIKDKTFRIPLGVNFYDNKVAISLFQSSEMAGVIIHSRQFYDFMDNIFQFMWKTAGKIKE